MIKEPIQRSYKYRQREKDFRGSQNIGLGGMREGLCALLVERHRNALSFALLIVAYVLYLLVGAGVFSSLELPYELELRRELDAVRRDFLEDNSCVSDEQLDQLLARALEASNYGVSVLGNDTEEANWDFVSSLFFTSTVLTTTGYGHTVPLSDGGKAFCILYTLMGIPMTLLFLSAVVQRIMRCVTRRPVAYLHRRWGVSRPRLAAVHAACLTAVAATFFLFIPAGVFMTWEKDWSFLEALYFCFISLTTIGLGDYVPGETHSREHNPHRLLYRLGITVYLLVGLVCMLVVLETCCELPQMKSLRRRFYREKSTRELDSETANIVEHEQLEYDEDYDGDDEPADRVAVPEHRRPAPVISSVSQQAASLRQDGDKAFASTPYTPAAAASATGTANGKLS